MKTSPSLYTSSRFSRIRRFLAEMFPVFPAQIATLGSFAVTAWVLATFFFTDGEARPQPIEWISGAMTVVLWNLQLRCFDEIKDYKSDQIHFPDRPLVSGSLKHSDLHFLIGLINLSLFCLQIPLFERTWVISVFLLTQIWSWLSFYWFFAESKIRPSLVLAFITHHPLAYLFQFYLLSFFAGSVDSAVVNHRTFALGVSLVTGFALLGTAWEFGRKIRGLSQETFYTTYSKIWGIVGSTRALSLALLLSSGLSLGAILIAAQRHNPDWVGSWIFALIPPLISLGRILYQISAFRRAPHHAPAFKQAVELQAIITLLSLAVACWIYEAQSADLEIMSK